MSLELYAEESYSTAERLLESWVNGNRTEVLAALEAAPPAMLARVALEGLSRAIDDRNATPDLLASLIRRDLARNFEAARVREAEELEEEIEAREIQEDLEATEAREYEAEKAE